jgi:Type IV secretion system pilin
MRDFITEKMLILAQVAKPTRDDLGLPNVAADQGFAKTVLAIVFGVAAAIAIVIIIVASFNLVKSQGNPEEISKAKKAIIFALIGLLVAISAELIVSFVIDRL